jgi:hypothetical protein
VLAHTGHVAGLGRSWEDSSGSAIGTLTMA